MFTAKHNLSFRRVKREDTQLLFDLFCSVVANDFDLFPDEQKQILLRQQYKSMRHAYAGEFPNGQHRIISLHSSFIGQIYTSESANEIRLIDIAIDPEQRNKGFGSMLIKQMINCSTKTNTLIRCNVRAMNVDAQRFYRRHGFTQMQQDGPYLQFERQPDC